MLAFEDTPSKFFELSLLVFWQKDNQPNVWAGRGGRVLDAEYGVNAVDHQIYCTTHSA